MSTSEPAPNRDDASESAQVSRWASLELADGDLVIYEPADHRAWIQSDAAVTLDEVC
jgi:hypothetical protein